jgi:CRISPR-associated endonuclease/helicase Cas3
MHKMLPSFYRYWGKSDPLHLVVYHCLDVAAVMHTYLQHEKQLLQQLSKLSQLPAEHLLPLVTFSSAIHDLGKFSNGFQYKKPELMQQLQGTACEVSEVGQHDLVGSRVWSECLQASFLSQLFSDMTPKEHRHLGLRFNSFSQCAFGHHGYPVRNCEISPPPLHPQFPAQVKDDVLAFVLELAALFQIRDKLVSLPQQSQQSQTFTWLLAGAMVLADWVGSSTQWFRKEEQPVPLLDYWVQRALPQAEQAVQEAKVLSFVPQTGEAIKCLFPDSWQATPLQQLAATIPLAKGPQLYILEEVTGAGKTEAAMLLSLRLLQAGYGNGMYFSLPTMATASAMYGRLQQIKDRVFTSTPVLSLAHSQAKATQAALAPNDAWNWAQGSNKRAMFSQLGAGTIDQALVAVLPQPHQSFRLLGLTQKVIIVDEVHATDSYMLELLCNFLHFHAALGGSVILLSATLPKAMRQQLVDAFSRGCGVDTTQVANNSYPLLTQFSAEGLHEEHFAARFSRYIRCKSLSQKEDMNASIRADLKAGKCVCRLSNTIHAALREYKVWKKEYPGTQLFHSRYTQGDRFAIEQSILRNFGPQSTEKDRRGKLLIATQVVEQSLDIDFDEIYTDLAPIDLLIQRTGRLNRHARTSRGTPCLHVLAPVAEKDVDKGWFGKLFPKADKIYPHHGQLWKTASWLQQRDGFSIPENAREMLEYVYSNSIEVPQNLWRRSRQAELEEHENANEAGLNQLKLGLGYAQSAKWGKSEVTPTRLGEPCQTWRLFKESGTGWVEYNPVIPGSTVEESSDINLPIRILCDENKNAQEQAIIERLRNKKPGAMKYKKILLLHPTATPEVWTGIAMKKSSSSMVESVIVTYDSAQGLHLR